MVGAMKPLRRLLVPLALSLSMLSPAVDAAMAVDTSCPVPVAPPQGTVQACSAGHLADILNSSFQGRVIIPRDANWELKRGNGAPVRDLEVKSGVEIVGERGALGSRPTLYTNDLSTGYDVFRVTGNDVRISGLHLRGPKPPSTHDRIDPNIDAIQVFADYDAQTGRRVLIEENELDQWSHAGVDVRGTHAVLRPEEWDPAWTKPVPADASLVRVERNYIHDNIMDTKGYGVETGGGAYASVTGNVFDNNRHAVASSGKANTGYVARFNYVLHNGIKENDSYYNQHFDVHGIGDGGYGGPAGTFFDVSNNTIRGEQDYRKGFKARPAVLIRGKVETGYFFRGNVVVHDDLDEAVGLTTGGFSKIGIGEDHGKFNFRPGRNQYDTDYSTEIASGDFDGDGRTDVFVANGTGWWYSRAGIKQWELLRPSTERTRDLGFADINNDGRTDVVSRDSAGKLGYHEGGSGTFQRLPNVLTPVSELRFGDFDGDRKTDIFHTRGNQWYVYYGSTGRWTPTQTSSAKIGELLFGNFDATPGTDVVAIRSNGWAYSSGSTTSWTRFAPKHASSFENAVVADFDGDGQDDIGLSTGSNWRYSKSGRAKLAVMRSGNLPYLKSMQFGRYDGSGSRVTAVGFSGDRLVEWKGAGSGNLASVRSAQDLR